MTIGVAWIRQGNREAEELLVATDSRLGGDGYIWDECPKITPLPRRDALAAFSGSTAQAYPLLLQIANAIRAYRPAEDGTLEFFEVIGHLERVANTMMGTLVVDPALRGSHTVGRQFATSGDVVIVGGYSRRRAKVVLRALQFDGAAAWRFARVRGAPSVGGRTMRVFGDNRSRSRFRFVLRSLLEERGLLRRQGHFSFEPLEALATMLRLPASAEIRLPLDRRPASTGGAPQVVRIIPGAQATPFVVRWEEPNGTNDYLFGRRTFEYEHVDLPLIRFSGQGITLDAPGQWDP
jgi:hypothetical protein